MINVKKGTVLQRDAFVLEKNEEELFLQFKKFYEDFQSGVFVEKAAKIVANSNSIQTQSTSAGDV